MWVWFQFVYIGLFISSRTLLVSLDTCRHGVCRRSEGLPLSRRYMYLNSCACKVSVHVHERVCNPAAIYSIKTGQVPTLEPRRSIQMYQPQVQQIIDQHTELDRVLYNAAKLEYEKVRQPQRLVPVVPMQCTKKDHLSPEYGCNMLPFYTAGELHG